MYKRQARDGARYTGKNIYVVGGADGAVKEALYLASFARRLTLIHFEEQLGCIAEFRQKVAATPNITLRLGTRLRGVFGRDCVEQLELVRERDGFTETLEDPGCGVFVYAGIAPNTDLFLTLAPVSYTHLDVYKRQVVRIFSTIAFICSTTKLSS